ncbi:condensation domain-containing protein, partial [Croceitalea sp. MTPC5]|uniref:condensation domain-containing protein n=1 Tax=Croceitalea sp. MTPC5 TaxID=3056565 RepID=UPI0030CCF558
VGTNDDFFRIGGDSILSIQVSGRIRQLGLKCQVKDIFTFKTIRELARHLGQGNTEVPIQSEQGLLEGALPLLPIQQWFVQQIEKQLFEQPDHWNQSFLIKVPELDVSKFPGLIEKLVAHHDVFRVRYIKGKNWKQFYSKQIALPEPNVLDIGRYGPKELQSALTQWQNLFDLEHGPLFSMGYLYGYEDGSARIFLAMHHMIVDGVSWRILAEDIKTLYEGKALPAKGSSYRQWGQTIQNYPQDHSDEEAYWKEQISSTPSYGIWKGQEGKSSMVSLELDETLTKALLQKASGAYHTEINDLLLTALTYALRDINGNDSQSITLEGHGREDLDNGIDHSRTIGWFTSMFPIRLQLNKTIGESIISVKETLRKVPNKGIGFGAFAIDIDSTLNHGELPPVIFNYLGQFDSKQGEWQIVSDASGRSRSPLNTDDNLINVNGSITKGRLGFSVKTKLGNQKTQELGDAIDGHLKEIIAHCVEKLEEHGPTYTPSDFY